MQTTRCPSRNTDADNVMVNLRRESQGRIHSFGITRGTRWLQQVEQELLTLPEHPSSPAVFSWVCVTLSVVLRVMFCRLLFVLLSFFFWPLYCLSFFDWRILMTPLGENNTWTMYLVMENIIWISIPKGNEWE